MNKIALLFSGQGSQYAGMGKNLYNKYSIVKQTFEEASEAINVDVRKLCMESSMDELTKTENAQPAILTLSVAMFRVYMQEIGIIPEYLAGHSLGEFSALSCAGAIRFQDAVELVRKRGIYMQQAAALGTGAMAAISNISVEIIKEECQKASDLNEVVVISNFNSKDQIVVSGSVNSVKTVVERLTKIGAKTALLKVSAPFHSPLMKDAAEKLRGTLASYKYSELKYPVLSNVTALPYGTKDDIVNNLFMQMVQPVQWNDSVQYLQNNGVKISIELGPQKILKNLVKSIAPEIHTFSYDREEDILSLHKLLYSTESANKNLKGNLPTVISRCMGVAVCTKNNNWDNEEYNKGVIESYRSMQKLQEESEIKGQNPTKDQMKKALDLLLLIFKTKRTPIEEQVERINQILEETDTKELFADFQMPIQ